MEKPFYKSKAIWSGVLMAVLGLYQVATTGAIDLSAIEKWIMALGVVGIRQALG